MTQRNPMNERYQREDLGKTRKSAASAKPVTKAASSVRTASSASKQKQGGLFSRNKKPADTKGKQREADRDRNSAPYFHPDDAEYQRWRRLWLITIIGALVCTVLSFVLQMFLPADYIAVAYVFLVLGYLLIFTALWIDIAKVRKIRRAYQEGTALSRSKEATRQRKQEKAERKQRLEAAAAEQERKDAERAAKREARALRRRGKAAAVDADDAAAAEAEMDA